MPSWGHSPLGAQPVPVPLTGAYLTAVRPHAWAVCYGSRQEKCRPWVLLRVTCRWANGTVRQPRGGQSQCKGQAHQVRMLCCAVLCCATPALSLSPPAAHLCCCRGCGGLNVRGRGRQIPARCARCAAQCCGSPCSRAGASRTGQNATACQADAASTERTDKLRFVVNLCLWKLNMLKWWLVPMRLGGEGAAHL